MFKASNTKTKSLNTSITTFLKTDFKTAFQLHVSPEFS